VMEAPFKIGILCHPTYGGSGVVASELALSLAERGHCVHLFSHQVPPRLARSSGPVQMHVSQGLPYPLFSSTPHDLAITSSILRVHREEGLDVLHAHYALPHAVSAILAPSAAERAITTATTSPANVARSTAIGGCTGAEVAEEQGVLAAIKLLREARHGLLAPGGAIGRAPKADVERLLLDEIGDDEAEQKDAMGGGAEVDGLAVTVGRDRGVLGNQEGCEHG